MPIDYAMAIWCTQFDDICWLHLQALEGSFSGQHSLLCFVALPRLAPSSMERLMLTPPSSVMIPSALQKAVRRYEANPFRVIVKCMLHACVEIGESED